MGPPLKLILKVALLGRPINRVKVKTTMSNSIYVLSNPRIPGEYKVGKHRGGLGKLHTRYGTYIPDVKVHFLIDNVDAKIIEKKFKELRTEERIMLSHSQSSSEWFKLSLDQIITDFFIMMAGKEYGLEGDKKFKISEFDERVVKGTRIITAKNSPQVVIDLSTSSEGGETSDESV